MSENFMDGLQNHDMQTEILDSISCGVFAYTVPEHKLLMANDEAKRIIGCKENENPIDAIVNFLRNKIFPEDKKRVYEASNNLKNVGDTVKYSYRVIHGNEIMYLKSTLKMLQFADGQKYLLCSMLDITEQSLLMNSLAKERKGYRDALENGSEFTFLFDITDGYIYKEFITAHNINLIEQLGFSVPVKFDELLSRYIEKCGIRFASEKMAEFFTCKGLIDAFNSGITNAVTEFYNPETDMYIHTSCLMSYDDETGHITASVVANNVTDIRKKEKTRQEMLKSANDEMNIRLDTILNGISGGLKIADVNNDYKYEYISEGAALLQGYTVEEFLEKFGTRVTSNIYHEDGEKALAEAERQMAIQGHYAVKYRVPHKNGSIRWVIDRGKLVYDNVTGKKQWYILMQDITELEERNAQISNMLSMQEEMADSFSCGFFAYTLPERDVLIINQEADRIFTKIGMRREGIADVMSSIDGADIENVRRSISNLKKAGDRASYTFHADTKDGGKMSINADTKLLSFSNGKKYILSALTDITTHEFMEKKLDEERRRYRNALAIGSELIFTIDLNNEELETRVISENCKNLIESIGCGTPKTYNELADIWFADDRIVTSSREIDTVRTKAAMIKACENGTSIIDFEYYVPKINVFRRLLVLLYNVGSHVNASFILYDVTSDRSEEKIKRDTIQSLGNIYSALYSVSLRERMFRIFKANYDIEKYLPERCSFEYFYNMYTDKFVEDEHKEIVAEFLDPDNIQKYLREENYKSIEFKRKNLGWVRVTLVVSSRAEDGSVESVVFAGNVIDKEKAHEMKQQEALKAAYESANMANSAKTDFLANMSHDIRTPMNAIIGLTAIAGTHIDDKECVADCLSKITVSSKHLLGIINEVLDMSKIESGKMELQEDEFNLSELIDNLLTMCKPDVSSRKHELSVSVRNIEHERVIGDSQRIQQVFMNIMSNAIKYTPVGGKLSFIISEKATNKSKVGCYEFIFEDNGIGMSKEFQKHIFEPFTRADNDTRVDKIQGTGLGMPITKNIVQMMNGNIKVESELNKGTRITVTLFLRLKGNDEDMSYEKLLNLPVLVADDDEISCMYTCQILHELGMKGEWVLTGKEAVERVIKNHDSGNDFFAVILDWKMPEMDGVETTRQIRKHVGNDVPIIIISAFDWSDIELEARKAGANAFISKPLFKSRVVRMLNEIIGEEKKGEELSDLDALAREDFSGKRALLVEDNELNSEIAGEILGMAGLEIDYAKDGKEAVDIMAGIEDDYYDVVFMDIQMPIMNGYEAAQAIRALGRDYTKSVPIIAMTANAFAEDVAMAKNAGMNEHIAKPLDFGQLLKALQKWLR